jgi:hypothetical protein
MRARLCSMAARSESPQSAVIVAFILLMVTITIYRIIPFGNVNPNYLVEAQTLAAGQLLPVDSFVPAGYPLLLAWAIRF